MGKSPVAGYLDIEGILAVAKEQGVDAIHPGAGRATWGPVARLRHRQEVH